MQMTHKHDVYFSPHSTEARSLVMQIADYCNKRGIWYKISESTLGIGIVYGGNVGYVIDADRKTENSSEKPNNCEHITEDGVTCAKYPACDDCLDNPLNKVKGSERLVKGSEQTDCGDFADRLAYERGVKHAWEVAQKVFNSTVTFYEAEDLAKQIDKDINVRSKDERQTEGVWNAGYKTGYDKGYKDAQKVKDSQDLVKDLVDDEFNPYDEECMRCKHLKLKCEFIPTYCKFEPKDEPQTGRLCDNCEHYGGGEVCDHPSIGEVEMGGKGDTFPWIKETPKWCPLKDEPQINMAEDIVKSFGFKAESYRQAKAKTEPQTERSE